MTSEIGIQGIAVTIPTREVETSVVAPAVGIEDGVLYESIGFRSLTRAAEEQGVADLCSVAAATLIAAEHVDPGSVECAAVITQSPDGCGIPHTAAILQSRLELPVSCACFDLALGGSGYVQGLSILKGFMESNGFRSGLLFTCDLYSRFVGEMDGHASLLVGDAATVTLLSDRPKWTIGKSLFGTLGSKARAVQVHVRLGGRLVVEPEIIEDFAKDYGVESIRRIVQINGLSMDQVDRIVVQQAWKKLVEDIGDALHIPQKVGFYAEQYGDAGSSSIPIILSQNLAASDRCIALFGFGSGLSYATTVLQRMK